MKQGPGWGFVPLSLSLSQYLDFEVQLPPLQRPYDVVGDHCIIFTHLSVLSGLWVVFLFLFFFFWLGWFWVWLGFFESTGGRR